MLLGGSEIGVQCRRDSPSLFVQDLTPHGRTVIFDPNVSGTWGGGVRHGMCFQSLTKFGQAVCDMGGIIVLNIEERGWRFNTGPQHTICDEIVGRSLRNPDLLVKSKGRCGTVVVPRSVLSFESAGRSDSAAGIVLGAAGLGSDAPMAVRRCCFASSSSARSLVGVEVILHHLRSVPVLHRIRCKEPLRPSLPALRRLTIGGKLPPCSPWIGLWRRLLGRASC